jgi:putative phosphoesterase
MNTVHRIALISDLHANAIALRRVLHTIREQGCDEIVCLGDLATLGPAPCEVVDMVRDLRCRCVMGNHDEYLFDPELARAHSSGMILDAIDWSREQLTTEQIDFARSFESGFVLPLGDHHQLQLFHGSPSSNMVDLLAETPEERFDAQLGPERATVMAGGHTHVQMMRQHRGTLVVNPGSVGAPFREFVNGCKPTILAHAEYATVEARGRDVSVTQHRVALDRDELRQAALASSNPMRDALASPYA